MSGNDIVSPSRNPVASGIALLLFVGGCLAVSAAGGLITRASVDTWYATLLKPELTPPNWVFPAVWTTIFVLMAIAAWRIWRAAGWRRGRSAFVLFGAQLALNLGWSALFFGLQMIGAALFEAVALLALVIATLVAFWKIDRVAGALLVPYALWVGYAVFLTAMLWRLNPV